MRRTVVRHSHTMLWSTAARPLIIPHASLALYVACTSHAYHTPPLTHTHTHTIASLNSVESHHSLVLWPKQNSYVPIIIIIIIIVGVSILQQ